jgi:hypothetical protein
MPEDWRLTYSSPSMEGDPHLVYVWRPAGWRPVNDPLLADKDDEPEPRESYCLPYVEDGSVTEAVEDRWVLGPRFVEGDGREVPLMVGDAAKKPPEPIATDRPVIRDGHGGGVEEGTLTLTFKGVLYTGKYKKTRTIRMLGRGPKSKKPKSGPKKPGKK